MEMLSSLDLFTGIAGFTWGLRDIAVPISYCEIDTHAMRILQKNMKEGCIPTAPICEDVAKLSSAWILENTQRQHATVDVMTAGPGIVLSERSSSVISLPSTPFFKDHEKRDAVKASV